MLGLLLDRRWLVTALQGARAALGHDELRAALAADISLSGLIRHLATLVDATGFHHGEHGDRRDYFKFCRCSLW